MKSPSLRHFLIPIAAIAMGCLNSCCCPCNTKAALLEDFWVSPEQQIERREALRDLQYGQEGDARDVWHRSHPSDLLYQIEK